MYFSRYKVKLWKKNYFGNVDADITLDKKFWKPNTNLSSKKVFEIEWIILITKNEKFKKSMWWKTWIQPSRWKNGVLHRGKPVGENAVKKPKKKKVKKELWRIKEDKSASKRFFLWCKIWAPSLY